MKVIVTGGAGFIGSNLVDRLLEKGIDTYVIDNISTGQLKFVNPKATFFKEDILDFKMLAKIFKQIKPDAVFHMAAQIDIQTSIQNPSYDAETNIIGSLHIIELCKQYNCKLIYSSSAAVYGTPSYLPINESHPTKPLSNYGISKFTPELYIQSYSQLFNLNYIVLRYSNVFGIRQIAKGEGGVISIFINKLIKNESPVIFGNGQQTRDFIYIEDVVSANISALYTSTNGTYNISSNHRVTIRELVKMINLILNKTVDPVYQPARKGDIIHSCLDNRLAKRELNWRTRISLFDGLAKTCEYYLTQNEN